jgi:hypothetical protein
MFLDIKRLVSFSSTSSIINSLSDYDFQYLVINNIIAANNLFSLKQRARKINNETIVHFVKQ